MGQGLPKAVTPVVLERDAGPLFQVGLAEMNGWRPSMEDAHVVIMRDNWGFFGVFDGHGGGQCSAFVAKRLTEELSKAPIPENNEAVKSLMLRLDQEFLDTQQPSGSTGTFAFVLPPENGADKVRLRVGNIGDSRVLLGRADGSIVEGPGTDAGLTTDHKPDNEVERERIYRTGGTVETIMGVARVNGDLAVSRAFGDAPHKKTGGPKQEDHPVSVEPEFTDFSCDSADFLMLVCDGISEGNFPNAEVVQLAAEQLKTAEPAEASAAVCQRALERGSMDNLSCMIVLFKGGEKSEKKKKELLPAPFLAPTHAGYRKAYSEMAGRARVNLEEAVEQRYHAAKKAWEAAGRGKKRKDASESPDNSDKEDPAVAELRSELDLFGEGPPENFAEGSPESVVWFKGWLDGLAVEPTLDPSNMSRAQLMDLLERDPEMLAMAQAQGWVGQNSMRTVTVAPEAELKPAMEAHPALKWDDRLTNICGDTGRVLQDDPSDGTAQVRFRGAISAEVWLPVSCLSEEGDMDRPVTRKVRVASLEDFKTAVEGHKLMKWQDTMEELAGQMGLALEEDANDGTTRVRFPGLRVEAWLPTSVLTEEGSGDDDLEDDSDDDDDEDEDDAEPLRKVLVPSAEKVKSALEAHETLKWEDALAGLCDQQGEVIKDDEADGSSCVRFPDSTLVWLPTALLEAVDGEESGKNGEEEEDGGNGSKRQKTS